MKIGIEEVCDEIPTIVISAFGHDPISTGNCEVQCTCPQGEK
jgi:hypothetical protein